MNCAECRDNMVGCVEGVLDPETAEACNAHLENCAECQKEHAAIVALQRQLIASGKAAAEMTIVAPVMRQVRQLSSKPEKESFMSKLYTRWGLGLGAVAGAAAVVLAFTSMAPRAQAKAADVLARGAQAVANLTSIHLRGQLRTQPQDNFSAIDPKCDFVAVELWKEFAPEQKWRIDKPGRFAVMDGHSTVMVIKTAKVGMKFPQAAASAFDTGWLHEIANLSNTISNELTHAIAKGWKLGLKEETAADGRVKSIVTVEAKSNLPENDYLKNASFHNADTRRVYHFDGQTGMLEGVQIYLIRNAVEVQVFDLNQIEYNQPFEPAVFQPEIPADVNWYKEPEKLADNDTYASMTAEQAARAFFEACGRGDWNEVEKFMSPMPEIVKTYLSGVEVVSLGESFTSTAYAGRFVPYEIKIKSGGVKKHNLALRKDNSAKRWQVDGGI